MTKLLLAFGLVAGLSTTAMAGRLDVDLSLQDGNAASVDTTVTHSIGGGDVATAGDRLEENAKLFGADSR